MPPLVRSNSYVDIDHTLRKVFKKSNFRPLQREVITAALQGQDVFLQAATSFGKSLCYQLPAVVDHRITIVISPLLSLMNNQVDALRVLKICAASINSTTSYEERSEVLKDLETGHPLTRLLYVTPEYCMTESFRRKLALVHEQRELARFAIDEAHCISEWGHDFRKSFKELKFFREAFPDVPIMCLTATATLQVRQDIISTLGLSEENMKVFTMSTDRENLHYEVRFKSDEGDHFSNFLKWLRKIHQKRAHPDRLKQLQVDGERTENVSGIIYTLYRRDCEDLAAGLRAEDIGARPFHAGLSTLEKADTLTKWVNNVPGYDIIVATTAFGMGIDKKDVRFVVHWQLPKSFEGFYQEAGRAGRDGKAAVSMVYYSREDQARAFQRLHQNHGKDPLNHEARSKSLKALVTYCETTETCRHKLICKYFGETQAPVCDYACDWHKDVRTLKRKKLEKLADEEWIGTQLQAGNFESMAGYD